MPFRRVTYGAPRAQTCKKVARRSDDDSGMAAKASPFRKEAVALVPCHKKKKHRKVSEAARLKHQMARNALRQVIKRRCSCLIHAFA